MAAHLQVAVRVGGQSAAVRRQPSLPLAGGSGGGGRIENLTRSSSRGGRARMDGGPAGQPNQRCHRAVSEADLSSLARVRRTGEAAAREELVGESREATLSRQQARGQPQGEQRIPWIIIKRTYGRGRSSAPSSSARSFRVAVLPVATSLLRSQPRTASTARRTTRRTTASAHRLDAPLRDTTRGSGQSPDGGVRRREFREASRLSTACETTETSAAWCESRVGWPATSRWCFSFLPLSRPAQPRLHRFSPSRAPPLATPTSLSPSLRSG